MGNLNRKGTYAIYKRSRFAIEYIRIKILEEANLEMFRKGSLIIY